MVESKENPIDAMSNYTNPEDVYICRHRKHSELSKVIDGLMQAVNHILEELKVIEAVIGKETMCKKRKILNKIKVRELFLKQTENEIHSLKKELN